MVLWNTPAPTHVRRVSRPHQPGVTSVLHFTRRFVIFALVVICDQMGTSKSPRPIVGDF